MAPSQKKKGSWFSFDIPRGRHRRNTPQALLLAERVREPSVDFQVVRTSSAVRFLLCRVVKTSVSRFSPLLSRTCQIRFTVARPARLIRHLTGFPCGDPPPSPHAGEYTCDGTPYIPRGTATAVETLERQLVPDSYTGELTLPRPPHPHTHIHTHTHLYTRTPWRARAQTLL